MTLPRRITQPALPYSAAEVLSRMKVSSLDEATLVESYLYAAMDRIETVCERAVTFCKYELKLAGVPYGVDDTVGPMPFSQNYYDRTPGVVRTGRYGNADFKAIQPPAILLEMPTVQPNGSTIIYYNDLNVSTSYTTYSILIDEPGYLHPNIDTVWPELYPGRRDAMTITFWAGDTDLITWDSSETFTSSSGYNWADGDQIQLRASGNQNSWLGECAAVPTSFTANTTYYVVSASGATFKLSATSGGSAITGTPPATGFAIDKLYANRLNGNVEAGVMKIAIDSYKNRCGMDTCSVSGDDDRFMQDPVLRRMAWRSPLYN
jgi:hypothetical protein